LSLAEGVTLPEGISFNADTRTFSGTAQQGQGSFNIEVLATDEQGASVSDTLQLTVNQPQIVPEQTNLQQPAEGILNLENVNSNDVVQHRVSLEQANPNDTVEVGFTVLEQGQSVQDALNQGSSNIRSLFSVFPEQFNIEEPFRNTEPGQFPDQLSNLSNQISLEDSSRIGYVLAQGRETTIDQILQNGNFDQLQTQVTNVQEQDNNSFDVQFDQVGFNVTLQTNQNVPLGSNQQGQPQSEFFDLRNNQQQQVEATLTNSVSEAAFSNVVGFYTVDNNDGVISRQNGDELAPDSDGYVDALLNNAVQDSQGNDVIFNPNEDQGSKVTIQGGDLVVPFLLANGGEIEQLPDSSDDIAEDAQIFTPFAGSNPNGSDHFRLLGNNTFAVEDLPGQESDFDYNDAIFQVELNAA